MNILNSAAPLLGACLLAGFVPSLAFGQTTGRIVGTVRDTSSGAIGGATVTAINLETAQPLRATTDAAGTYTLQLLPPGSYDVSFEVKDFRTSVFSGVPVTVTETTTLDAVLKVGAVAQP
jgi:hypothetical protein